MIRINLLLAAVFGVLVSNGIARASGSPATEFTLPSARPVGDPTIDTIHIQWHPALSDALSVDGRTPALVIVPGLGDTENSVQDQRAARYFSERGIDCAIVLLPYSGHRLTDGRMAQDYYLSRQASTVTQAMREAASDIETVREWLASRPDVDPSRVGVIAWSEGAILLHLAMGLYPQIDVGVAIGGGGDLADIRNRSLLLGFERLRHPFDVSPPELRILAQADPITYAKDNQPRHVLMVEATRDYIVPTQDGIELWNDLGHPPIRWADMGHVGLGWAETSELNAAYAYFMDNWKSPGAQPIPVPQVTGALIKTGFVDFFRDHTVLAVQDQVMEFGHKPDHTSLFGMNVGVSTSRPFAGFAYTVNQYLDAGVALRVGDHSAKPYVSLYVPL